MNSIDSDDNGDYECSLPNGKKYKYRLTVIDIPSISYFETRSTLKTPNSLFVTDLNESVEQVCSSATTSSYLSIEWYDQNGKVCVGLNLSENKN